MWQRQLSLEVIPQTALVLARVCDLVEEFRWRYGLTNVVFRERISQDGTEVRLESLWMLGWDADDFLLYATRDQDALAATVDAGGFLVESSTLDGVIRRCRGRQVLGLDAYDLATLLATDLLRV